MHSCFISVMHLDIIGLMLFFSMQFYILLILYANTKEFTSVFTYKFI